MVATNSTMQELGTPLPQFELPDVVSRETVSSEDLSQRPCLIMFICNHCPYVIHVMEKLSKLANDYQKLGFAVVAISSNDVQNYPQDSPEKMVSFATQYGFEFPYAYDESQQVAMDFGAACTPDFFVYDHQHSLVYRGQLDGSRPGNSEPVSGADLKAALDAVLEGKAPLENQLASIGCNIKWKSA